MTDAQQEAAIRNWQLAERPDAYRARAAWNRRVEIIRREAAHLRRLAELHENLDGGSDPAALFDEIETQANEARRLELACARVCETAQQVAQCARAGLTRKQTAAVLGISLPRVYQCLNEVKRQYLLAA